MARDVRPPGRAFVLENWGAFVLHPVDSSTTRFFVRTRGEGAATLASIVLGPISTFVFEPRTSSCSVA